MSEATDMLALYISAEKAVLKGQSYTIGSRSLTRANLPEIRTGRQEWESKVRGEQSRNQGGSSLSSVADFRE